MSNVPWILKMAWRDSRGSRQRLALYLSAMVLGVAALVAIRGFGDNMSRTVDQEAKTLLGADLRLESEQPFDDSTEVMIDSIGGTQSRRISFGSMAVFPKNGGTRLTAVRAVEGGFPFYGALITQPDSASQVYQTGRRALVSGTLLNQFDAQVGDSVRIGRVSYQIAGEIQQAPGESSFSSAARPPIYIPKTELDTSLLSRGSLAEYEVYFKFEDDRDVSQLVSDIEPFAERRDLDTDTVEEEAEDWREGLGNLYRFLSLVGFVALLLGSLGVASAVHVYVRQRLGSIAVLRCLGASAGRTFRIYLAQAGVLGLLGAGTGSLIGIGLQAFVPRLLADFLPFDVSFSISWVAVGLGLGVGLGVTLLFALWPLLEVRGVSPMRALRTDVDPTTGGWCDPARWAVAILIAAGVTGVSLLQAPSWEIGLGYAGGVAGVFGVLALVSWGIVTGVQRFFPSSWPYPWRQGLANLYRPQNQTTVLMLALGLGTFLIVTLFLVQQTLLEQIKVTGGKGQPNLVLFDVQNDQADGVKDIVKGAGLPLMADEPIVTMRMHSVNGRTIKQIRQDTTRRVDWAHEREYRVTYRDHLTSSETLVEGEFVGEVDGNPIQSGAAVPISLEQEIAREDLNVSIGDTLTFDVQGRLVTTYVSSIRQVDWQRIGTNYFVVFPEGVLEAAPQMHVILSRSENDEASAQVQRQVVQKYPNVSAIDLSLVLSTFRDLFGRLSYVIRFMALFSIVTGLIVLAGAVVVSRYQRAEESVLLKTLGASRKTVLKIMTVEYLFLGVFAAATGIVLALAAAWSLSYFVFEGPFVVAPWALAGAFVTVTLLTIGIGLFNSRGLYDRPPMDVLRAEV
ncbi:permease [Salinibacter sp. 10B]|uniref:ABC transporter permease n=1 Tax=Salinibacter sp. 10B TaxID=1923971 RepID=UPI000CF3710D|nr:FtsX-like permease family protein [Salinibacter sp. 10B]PQJ35430.1 permease [Salinibacter sp. 10B]